MPALGLDATEQSSSAACPRHVTSSACALQELAEARRSRRQPTRMSGYGSRTSSPERDGVSPVRTPTASPAKPNR